MIDGLLASVEIDPRLEGAPQSTIDAYIWLKKYSGQGNEYIEDWISGRGQLPVALNDVGEVGPRSDFILHNVNVSDWSDDESFGHLWKTYSRACEAHPDVMEKFQIVSIDIEDERKALKAFWRMALQETFLERFKR